MADINFQGMFDSFYDKLVLRDLVGKVVPGTLFLFAIMLAALGPKEVEAFLAKMTFALWVVVGGFSWLLAFALQYVGETCKLLRVCPYGKDKSKRQTREDFYPTWASFQKQATRIERLHAERLNIIKEACGNAAVSLISGSLFVGVSWWSQGALFSFPEAFFVLLALFLSFCFWQMHVIHVERYGDLVHKIVDGFAHNDSESSHNKRVSGTARSIS